MEISRGHIHSGGKTSVDDRRNFSKTGLCGQQRKSNLQLMERKGKEAHVY